MEGSISTSPNTRIAVVTGGNKGIGLEVCKQLAGNGITVVLTARDDARGAAAVEKLKGKGLSRVIFHQLEITDASSVDRLADFLKTRFGKLDILVNNAAIGGVERVPDPVYGSIPGDEKFNGMDASQRIEWMRNNCRETYEAAKQGVQTNYYGTKRVTEALLPLLRSSSDPRIVNVSSNFGLLSQFSSEELKNELNDIDSLTEERLDELLDTFLKDMEAGGGAVAEARGWPSAGFSAYKARQLRAPRLREDRHDQRLRDPDAGGGREQRRGGGAAAGRRADRRVLPCRNAGVVRVIDGTYVLVLFCCLCMPAHHLMICVGTICRVGLRN